MPVVRGLARGSLLFCLLVAACVDGQLRKLFFGLRPGPAGAVWVHRWCSRILRSLDIACTIEGPVPVTTARSLALVSNHLSYLDILVYAAATPFVMVAKTEVRHWPLIGWITAQAGTVYIERADVKGGQTQTRDQVNAAMSEAFGTGLPVLFYPEGTTTDGGTILPFRRGLFNSVVQEQVPLRVAALAYTLDKPNPGSEVASHVCYWGDMVFGTHLFHCLGLRGLHAHVRFGADEVEGEDRFALALNAREEMVAMYAELLAGETTLQEHVPCPTWNYPYARR